MENWRIWRTVFAVGGSIIFNCILTILVGIFSDDTYYFGFVYVGLLVAPIIGGTVRSLFAYKKDLRFIIPSMFVLDVLVFVPLIYMLTKSVDYQEGIERGLLTGLVQTLSGVLVLVIRLFVSEASKKHNLEELEDIENAEDTEDIRED